MVYENILPIIEIQIEETMKKIEELKQARKTEPKSDQCTVQAKIPKEMEKKIKMYCVLHEMHFHQLLEKLFSEVIKNAENELGKSLLSLPPRYMRRFYSKRKDTELRRHSRFLNNLRIVQKKCIDFSKEKLSKEIT